MNMERRKELPYFEISGEPGGNQEWFSDPWMYLGGCGATTACDFCIQQAVHAGRENLVPFPSAKAAEGGLSRREYVRFGMAMKPFLRPRWMGINSTRLFMDGFQEYLRSVGETGYVMRPLEGDQPVEAAWEAVRDRIDAGIPVPFLTLHHKDPEYKDLVWHWYPVIGYREEAEDFVLKTATYGEVLWLSLRKLWDTGYDEKGGIVLIHRIGE